ncbi:MAG TPA: hypothetical protein VG389_19970 [Myxococcota bacterium]|jgi:hypothetical protein|nr:hypothetical protein [Myxococcota bacterium]
MRLRLAVGSRRGAPRRGPASAAATAVVVVDGLDDFEAGTFTLNVTGP